MKRMISLLLALVCAACLSVPVLSAEGEKTSALSGWQRGENGTWRYYENGVQLTGWQKIDGKWYLFTEGDVGEMLTGFRAVGDPDSYYYLKDSGELAYGWQKIGGRWYYFDSSGKLHHGWLKSGGEWYYIEDKMNARGIVDGMLSGGMYWVEEDEKSYIFDTSGRMLSSQWVNVSVADPFGSHWEYHYVGADGAVYQGWKKLSGSWFYFQDGGGVLDEDGVPMPTWIKLDGLWYIVSYNNSRSGEYSPAQGFIGDGLNTVYYFEEPGQTYTGWKRFEDGWRYFDRGGKMALGWKQIDGTWYNFRHNASVSGTGDFGNIFDLDHFGVMRTGWQQIGGAWYYFKSSGAMAENETVNGYTFDSSGVWVG